MASRNSELDRAAVALNASIKEAIALLVRTGEALDKALAYMGPEAFADWCPNACRVTLPEAELMMRWGTAHRDWGDPAAVDMANPLAVEIFELATIRAARMQETTLPLWRSEAAQ
jgi:hypothetical protein